MAKKINKSNSLQLIIVVFVALIAVATVFILTNKSLYNQLTRTGAEGLYGPYLDIKPCDGTWNTTTCFNVSNITENPVAITYLLDCWDETKCADKTETIILKVGETVKIGLGSPCSEWQLDINWSGRTDGGWDWGGRVLASTVCSTATPTASPTVAPTATPCTNTFSFPVK